MMIRSYSDLLNSNSFEDRYHYLRLKGDVGRSTFGFDRYVNQQFYTSTQWRHVRQKVIARDEGCDLGVNGYEIYDKIVIHHMNPMAFDDIEAGIADILNPEYLITTSHRTHNAIHFGDERLLVQPLVVRRPKDTKLWD